MRTRPPVTLEIKPHYYFRIEDQVPENHLLRLIDRYVRFCA